MFSFLLASYLAIIFFLKASDGARMVFNFLALFHFDLFSLVHLKGCLKLLDLLEPHS